MKLNGLDIISWIDQDNKVTFVLRGSVLTEAAALDGQTFTVMDEETQIAIFAGYTITSVSLESGNTVIRCMREIEESSEEAIAGLDANVKALTTRVDNAEQDVANLTSMVNDVADSTNPEILTFAKMAIPAMTADMTTTEVCSIAPLLPEWKVGAHYALHEAFVYEGKVYRAAQEIPAAQDIYKPGQGTESLYTLIELADDGVRIWKKPTDATNSFALGERAHYPTGTDPIYVSKRDGNDSEPTKDKWWELESE